MKVVVDYGWHKGEAWRLFPNVEIYNNPDNFWVSFVFCKWNIDLGLESSYEKRGSRVLEGLVLA